jgi:hypothetical protein
LLASCSVKLAADAARADGVGGDQHVTRSVGASYVAFVTRPASSAAYMVVRVSLPRRGSAPKRHR